MDAEIQAQAFKADSYHMLQSLEEKDDLIREWAEFFEHFVRPLPPLPPSSPLFSFLALVYLRPSPTGTQATSIGGRVGEHQSELTKGSAHTQVLLGW